jgi:hypothetical protein
MSRPQERRQMSVPSAIANGSSGVVMLCAPAESLLVF